MNRKIWPLLLLIIGTFFVENVAFASETIVLNGVPTIRSDDTIEKCIRKKLSEREQFEARVIIVKKNGKYIWKTRQDRILEYNKSGVFHSFIDKRGGGCIKVLSVPVGPNKNKWLYLETMTHTLDVYNYWGISDIFDP